MEGTSSVSLSINLTAVPVTLNSILRSSSCWAKTIRKHILEHSRVERFSKGLKNYDAGPKQKTRRNYYKDSGNPKDEHNSQYMRLADRPKSNPKHPAN